MEGFCRGCLIKYDYPEELLEYTEKNRRLFIYSTGLQVKRNDIFTFQLCKDCYVNMQQSCRFKKLCRLSDKKFKTYLSLKEAGETLDLCTYLKNNDDNFNLRWAGNSTPANQKKDDDNESTCTSIRNFMQDILQGTEVPDTEAGIIKQVIEEEADVLDDSLDSHWLQDDASIATDFRLDFSPFSTPRSVWHTPQKEPAETPKADHFDILDNLLESSNAQDNYNDQRKKTIGNRAIDDILSDSLLDNSFGDNFDNEVKTIKFYDEKEIRKIENNLITNLDTEVTAINIYDEKDKIENNLITEQVASLGIDEIVQVNSKNYYIDKTYVEQPETFVEQPVTFVNQPVTLVEQQLTFDGKDVSGNRNKCTDDLDRRLSNALQNDENVIEMSLQDPLGSPTTLVEQPVTLVEQPVTFVEQQLAFDGKDVSGNQNECTDDVDKRLSNAIQMEEDVIELSLQDPLRSRTVFPTPAAPSTPLINNILFREILDENISQDHIGSTFNNIDDVTHDDKLYDLTVDVKIERNTPQGSPHPAESNDLESDKSKPDSSSKYSICCVCDKKFKDMKSVRMHATKVHKIKIPGGGRKPKPPSKPALMICNYCDKYLRGRRNLVTHIKTHIKQTKITCDRCGLTFNKKSMYEKHLATHLGQHIRIKTSKGKDATCDICKMTMLKSSIAKHLLRHSSAFLGACEECGRGYHTIMDQQEHMRIHTGERPHVCHKCKKSFIRRNALIRHMRVHTGDIRFVCDNCQKGFAYKTSLIQHIASGRCRKNKKGNTVTILSVLDESVLKPFRCEFCHSRFKTKNFLDNHMSRPTTLCKELRGVDELPNVIEIVTAAVYTVPGLSHSRVVSKT